MPMPLVQWIARQPHTDAECWLQYAEPEETRREHLLELRAYLNLEPFGLAHYRQAVHAATELALQTDKGIVLVASVLNALRHPNLWKRSNSMSSFRHFDAGSRPRREVKWLSDQPGSGITCAVMPEFLAISDRFLIHTF